jgi:hypothetical protein
MNGGASHLSLGEKDQMQNDQNGQGRDALPSKYGEVIALCDG